ncbi:hypothetical protein BpHYR1_001173 [Brachionus plicatilis]|uniref:Uncharacterized protein n=1 Tax=Brachionus plicatilis TaxID=10195 RepID=A0A3M7PDD0_BRAPC|nr:hypothetical protein BpHYR1_001173 [Brachionus plicatilis]
MKKYLSTDKKYNLNPFLLRIKIKQYFTQSIFLMRDNFFFHKNNKKNHKSYKNTIILVKCLKTSSLMNQNQPQTKVLLLMTEMIPKIIG